MGHVYPAYSSYQAVQRRDTVMMQRWMIYWTVLGFFHLAESVGDTFIFWFPFYDEIKLAFILYLVSLNGEVIRDFHV